MKKYYLHGLSYHYLYHTWATMRQRCYKKTHHRYYLYGGRGIKVCKRWGNFANFVADMGERPNGYTLERINSNGDYTPDNCRWATPKEQALNRRNNILFTHKGKTQTVAEWIFELGLNSSTVRSRINQYHWPIAQALGLAKKLGKE